MACEPAALRLSLHFRCALAILTLLVAAGLCHAEPASASTALSLIGIAGGPEGASAPDLPVVVMIVSPRMVYALREWPRMRRSAEAAGFTVVTFRDPRVGDEEWQAALHHLGLAATTAAPRLPGTVLARIGVQNHFPSSVVRLGRHLHPWPVLGVMPDAAFVALLKARLRQLREMQ